MNIEDCYQAGYLLKPHGVMGQIKAVFDVHDISDYLNKKDIFISLSGDFRSMKMSGLKKVTDTQAIISFEGIGDRDAALSLRGAGLFFPLAELPPLAGSKFYYHEIVGFTVVDKTLGQLGVILRVDEMPAQDLIVMKYEDRDVAIPITDDFVLGPDREKKVLNCDLPEGLLEV